ncbi:MAG TPA: type II toxin-antitoxin system PemK/MazF family toxin [Candidatus Limnocylindrales bacterium]|nr:type II toxin-antitoxin system PemK/MazF family toxin [Candidatus Limnocylindrales bacterium]
MGAPSAGSVVLLAFPFSDLSRSKLRPAVVLASVGRGDFILCQITSNAYADAQAVALEASDFSEGSLQRTSYARPAKLFTANETLFVRQVGCLREETRRQIVERITQVLIGGEAG